MARLVFLILLALALGSLQSASADYLAYAVGEKSKIPLPQSIGKIDAKYLLNLE
jgi:hypothetical protein